MGIETAERELPDAILLDVMMPEMDGIATFKALQANPITAKIPVIFLTAKAQTAERNGSLPISVSVGRSPSRLIRSRFTRSNC